jgi:anaphase-promoting complex subunit 1
VSFEQGSPLTHSDSRTTPTNVFISENLWPHSVCVNVQYPSELACFRFTPSTCQIERRVQCKAAVPIISTRPGVQDTLVLRHDGSLAILSAKGREIPICQPRRPGNTHDDVTRRLASTLSMQVDSDERATPRDRQVVGLRYPAGSRVSVSFDDGETLRVSLDFTIKDRLVRQCSEALSCVLAPSDYFIFQRELLHRLRSTRHLNRQAAWDIFVTTLHDLLRMPRPTDATSGFEGLVSKARQSSRSIHRRLAEKIAKQATSMSTGTTIYGEHLDRSHMPSILFALHTVAQDCRCLSARQADFLLLGPLLSGLAGSLALVGWWDYWQRLVPCQAVLEKNST